MDLDKIIKKVPLDRVLLETDCPYLTPLPAEALAKAGPLRNEPVYVKYVAEKISKIKNIKLEELSSVTTQNAKKLFNI
jgi:TatD DNase family protein